MVLKDWCEVTEGMKWDLVYTLIFVTAITWKGV